MNTHPTTAHPMQKLKVWPEPDCDICYDEGSYERMHLGADNEPRYWTQVCECRLRTRDVGYVPVRVLGLIPEVLAKARVMERIAKASVLEMVWYRGRVISPALPDKRLAF